MFRSFLVWMTPVLLLLTFLLTYQWSLFQSGSAAQLSKQQHDPKTVVEVTHRNHQFYITQTFTDLSEKSYEVVIPKQAEHMQCKYNENEECIVETQEDKQWVTIREQEQLELEYTIAAPADQMLYTNWFTHLKDDGEDVLMDVEVNFATESGKPSKWIAPSNSMASIEKEHIQFFQWEKDNVSDMPLIHLINGNYEEYTFNDLFVYAKEGFSVPLEDIQLAKDKIDEPLVMVFDPTIESQVGDGYIVTPNANVPSIKADLLTSRLHNQYTITDQDKHILHAVIHLFEPKVEVSEKSKAIAEQIRSTFTLEQVNLWKELVLTTEGKGQNFPHALDQSLSSVYGYPTTYFQTSGKRNVPILYFFDTRPLYVNGDEANVKWHSVLLNEERYFPLAGLAELFQFEVVAIPSESEYIVRKGQNSWRFNVNKDTFIYNQEDFGIKKKGVVEIAEEVYIKSSLIEDIWDITVYHDEIGLYLAYRNQ
ncbi:hypothetical protein [Pontibacillus litoralis]|uniref:Uncharacterized protein n=1 Tax=Pontibacillus litoralis JSM 072002 TaxID=1385512 RepID=A0A0A5G972_9BACI|nr:hypothetical protein [Pontibacillus litoralis]KGX88564.1 hypothetical protein N784_07795 [Pontibacillus litoralis JSM 072002]